MNHFKGLELIHMVINNSCTSNFIYKHVFDSLKCNVINRDVKGVGLLFMIFLY